MRLDGWRIEHPGVTGWMKTLLRLYEMLVTGWIEDPGVTGWIEDPGVTGWMEDPGVTGWMEDPGDWMDGRPCCNWKKMLVTGWMEDPDVTGWMEDPAAPGWMEDPAATGRRCW
ncbi:uncharacterized protein LOC124267159 [Haliotis rubra]|uniref:uncharacterized protein LOC124267159 n=1 Tax=Haliotis rubra TaxID=36100 RepID=UPI001EE522AD|nr:uncharacterized protein LOC124267159 [Haliotis rubra]